MQRETLDIATPLQRDFNNFIFIVVSLVFVVFFCWFVWRFFAITFYCEVTKGKLCLGEGSKKFLEFTFSSIQEIRRPHLADLLNPVTVNLAAFSLFFRPCILIRANNLTYIFAPRDITVLNEVITKIDKQPDL